MARLAARYSVYLPVMALRAPEGSYQDKYDDAELPKVLGLFEERITAMKESLALESADTSKMMDATTSTARGGFPGELHGTVRRKGTVSGAVSGPAGQAELSSVFGIDTKV